LDLSTKQVAKDPSKTILLVEDNVINQRILRRKLEARGFSVTIANNGREAVEAVYRVSTIEDQAAGVFSCILMDQEMPVLDGNSATKVIRELESKGLVSHIPILGVTANVRDEQKAGMMAAGMDGKLLPSSGCYSNGANFLAQMLSVNLTVSIRWLISSRS
jgi:CheY-like chemotaxis protein